MMTVLVVRDYELNIKVISKRCQVSEMTVDCHELHGTVTLFEVAVLNVVSTLQQINTTPKYGIEIPI